MGSPLALAEGESWPSRPDYACATAGLVRPCPQPPIDPGTGKPMKPEDLAPIFPRSLIEQEVSTERWIEIPEPVLEIWSIWLDCTVYRRPSLPGYLLLGP